MGMIGSQLRSDLVEAHNGEVDEEAENAGSEKIPEPDRNEEHNRPAMRKWAPGPALLMRAELQKRPGLDRQERQRNHLRRGEKRAERHMDGRIATKVGVVHRADHATKGI